MYRLVLYYLLVLLAAAFVFSFFGLFPFNPEDLVFSTLLILAVGWVTNTVFAKGFDAMPGTESVYITSFIIALIVTPVTPTDVMGMGVLAFISAWAMASKYIFALGKKHLFNPAAFGVALAALTLSAPISWWAGGNLPLFVFVIAGGLLIVHKIKRFDLVLSFGVVAMLTILLTTPSIAFTDPIKPALLHTPIFFLAFVMLTEPLTAPPTRMTRIIYGAIVGFLFAPNIHIGSFWMTPELALLVGNVFVYIVSPKQRVVLALRDKKQIATDTFEFSFAPNAPLDFKPGQYLEWTLPHRGNDARGNRRYFTIASGPTEEMLRLGVKFSDPSSTFKKALWALKPNEHISATQLSGDFVLPKDPKQKLAFIAGGIGVTPFRSQVQHLIDTGEARSIVLLYAARTAADIAYKEVFDAAASSFDMKTVYAIADESNIPGMYSGMIDRTLIEKEIPDYRERMFYISGPHGMVETFKKTLREMEVQRTHIKTDYFPGFV